MKLKSHFFLIYFISKYYMVCLWSMYTSMQYLWRPHEDTGHPMELDYRQLWATRHGSWELTSNPLQEQQVLFIAEPSLRALISSLLFYDRLPRLPFDYLQSHFISVSLGQLRYKNIIQCSHVLSLAWVYMHTDTHKVLIYKRLALGAIRVWKIRYNPH